jgi:hypothetical protein
MMAAGSVLKRSRREENSHAGGRHESN